MPWTGSAPNQSFQRTDGTRTGADTWKDADNTGVKILSVDHDTHDEDIADGLSACLKRDGGNQATANIPMGEFRLTGIGDASARTSPIAAGQAADGAHSWYGSLAGTDTYTLSATSFSPSAYVLGQVVNCRVANANTGAVTVNIGAIGAKSVVRLDGSELSAGDWREGSVVSLIYDTNPGKFIWAGYPVLLAGTGIALTAQTLSLDLGELAAETSIATDDFVAIIDTSDGAASNKMTVANFLKAVNTLTEDTAPARSTDFVMTYDTSASAAKKVTVDNLGVVVALSKRSLSGDTECLFTTSDDLDVDKFSTFIIEYRNVVAGTSGSDIFMQFRRTGQGSYDAGASYAYSANPMTSAGQGTLEFATNASSMHINPTTYGLHTSVGLSGRTQVFNAPLSERSMIISDINYLDSSGGFQIRAISGGQHLTGGSLDGIRIVPSAGNFSGVVVLYGLRDPS